MPSTILTRRRVEAARPKKKTYSLHDRRAQGLSLTVTPKGRKAWSARAMCNGERFYERIGDAAAIDLDEARAAAKTKIAEFRKAATARKNMGPHTEFEIVAGIAFERRRRLWKPRTMQVSRECLKHITPFFGGMAIGGITHQHVREWYEGLYHIPTGANRAKSVLSAVLTEAEHLGCRPEGSNPVRGLRLYKRRERSRVLTKDEMGRLGRELKASEKRFPLQTSFIRLLVLTGCRKSEILELRWKDYRNGHLYLEDSKTGPKTVFLSTPAREVLDGIGTRRSKWVFPSKRGDRPQACPDTFWRKIRGRAGIEGFRLHDFRHNYATIAIRSGVSLKTVGVLLGHGQAQTTMRYAHLDDDALLGAAERATAAMAGNGWMVQ